MKENVKLSLEHKDDFFALLRPSPEGKYLEEILKETDYFYYSIALSTLEAPSSQDSLRINISRKFEEKKYRISINTDFSNRCNKSLDGNFTALISQLNLKGKHQPASKICKGLNKFLKSYQTYLTFS